MPGASDKLLDVVRSVHEAAFEPSGWPAALAGLVRLLGGEKAAITGWDELRGHVPFLLTHECEERWLEAYRQRYVALDPWVAGCRRQEAGVARLSDEMVAEGEFVRTEFYNDFCVPQRLHYLVGGEAVRQPGRNLHAAVIRAEGRGPFDPEQRDLMQAVFPHLALAIRYRGLLLEAEHRNQRLAGALDRLRAGIVILDASLKVAWLNRAADAQARDPSGAILVHHGQLVCRNPARQAELTLLLRRATEAAAGRGLFAGAALRLDREEGEPLAVHVSPLPPAARPEVGLRSAAAVLVVITDSKPELGAPISLLCHLYKLTPAEARLAAALSVGQTLDEHADAAGITRETARWYLKQVLVKTGCHRQGELVRLLTLGPAGLLRGERG